MFKFTVWIRTPICIFVKMKAIVYFGVRFYFCGVFLRSLRLGRTVHPTSTSFFGVVARRAIITRIVARRGLKTRVLWRRAPSPFELPWGWVSRIRSYPMISETIRVGARVAWPLIPTIVHSFVSKTAFWMGASFPSLIECLANSWLLPLGCLSPSSNWLFLAFTSFSPLSLFFRLWDVRF